VNERKPTVAVLLLLLCSGCAGTTGFGLAKGQQTKVIEPADQIAAMERLQKSNREKSGSQLSLSSEHESTWSNNSLTRGAKSAMSKVASALTIEPKVIKAPDPVRLVGNTTHVGYEVHLEAGRFFENQGQFDRAQDQYRRALEKEPNQLETLLSLGRLFDRVGNLPQAALIYQQAIAAHPESAVAHNDLGLCFARQEKFKPATTEFSTAIEADPQNKLYRNNIATVLVELGRFDDAFSQLALAHGDVIAHYNLGYLVQQKAGPERARVHYEQALRLDPDFAPARQALLRWAAPAQPPTVSSSVAPANAPAVVALQTSAPNQGAVRRPTAQPSAANHARLQTAAIPVLLPKVY